MIERSDEDDKGGPGMFNLSPAKWMVIVGVDAVRDNRYVPGAKPHQT